MWWQKLWVVQIWLTSDCQSDLSENWLKDMIDRWHDMICIKPESHYLSLWLGACDCDCVIEIVWFHVSRGVSVCEHNWDLECCWLRGWRVSESIWLVYKCLYDLKGYLPVGYCHSRICLLGPPVMCHRKGKVSPIPVIEVPCTQCGGEKHKILRERNRGWNNKLSSALGLGALGCYLVVTWWWY